MKTPEYPAWLSLTGRKILWFPLTRLILALAFQVAFIGMTLTVYSLIFPAFSRSGSLTEDFLRMALAVIASLAGYALYCRLIENRGMHELRIRRMLRQAGIGILIGAGFISLIILIMAVFGGYEFRGFNPASALLPILIMSLRAGVIEEVISRAIIFRITEEGTGTWISVAISALIFGFLHIWNANATILSCLSIALTAGVILALLYVLTSQLWAPIFMHIAWNFTLGGVYGAPVSGSEPGGLINAVMDGPEWLTGGPFGPEASVITIAIFVLFGIYLTIRVIKKSAYINPAWKKTDDGNQISQ